MEAVGRLLAGIAPWLDADGISGDEQALQQEFGELARQGLGYAVDPDHPDYLGVKGYDQPIVDTAFLAQALIRAPQALWQDCSTATQSGLVDLLGLQDDRKPFFNNWLLFAACTEAAKQLCGVAWDRMRVDYAVRQHEQWYLGDGHYGDGPEYHADFYNSFVIQPMLLDVLEQVAGHECSPWDTFWADQLSPVRARLGRYAAVQERLIHSDGTWPVMGRSICYRAGAFHALSTAAWKQLLPDNLSPAQVRCALTAVIEKGFADSVYDTNGWLRIGLAGHQPSLGEDYITTGSLYLASFVFPALALAEDDPFWSAPDTPWTSVRVWENGEDLPADSALKTDGRLI